MSNSSSTNTAAQLRQAWIERQLASAGTFRIEDGVAALGVSRAQISADLMAVMAANPKAITYHRSHKRYEWTPGSKVKTFLPEHVAAVNVCKSDGTPVVFYDAWIEGACAEYRDPKAAIRKGGA